VKLLRSKKIAVTLFAIGAAVLLGGADARACGCFQLNVNPTPVEQRAALVKDFHEAAAIFTGEVVALDALQVRFKIDKLWKGDFGDEITMSTGAKEIEGGKYAISSCDYSFTPGESYLVFAYGLEPDKLQAHACTRTSPLKNAERQMEQLDGVWPHQKRNLRPEQVNQPGL